MSKEVLSFSEIEINKLPGFNFVELSLTELAPGLNIMAL